MNIPTKYLAIGFMTLFAYQTNAKDVERKNSSPVQFMANAGQITNQHGVVRHDIDAKIEANGVVMFVGNGQLHYQWAKSVDGNQLTVRSQGQIPNEKSGGSIPPPARTSPPLPAGDNAAEVSIYRMDVTLVGANPNAQVVFEEPTGYYENYYLAHTGENGVVAKGYSKVTYKNVYPNIDFVLYVNSKSEIPNPKVNAKVEIPNSCSNIKYDFVVHTGGNPADIRLRYDGATELKLVGGALMAVTPYGTITEAAPYSYNAVTKAEVSSGYLLTGNELRFDIGQYEGTLVIDPVLKWGTYNGGTADESVTAGYSGGVATDKNGGVYLLAGTKSTGNIATTGAHQTSHAGNTDWMIAKFNEQGVKQWGTYYGGVKVDMPGQIAVDNNNGVYCIGYTKNSGLATSGAYQSVYKVSPTFVTDSTVTILAKFNASGVRQWATYYGDTCSLVGYAVVCDANNNVWIGGAGYGNGSSLLSTPGAYETNYVGGYFAQFSSSGSRLYASNYPADVHNICFDVNGNYFLTGVTSAATGIASTGAHQTAIGGAGLHWDGFIAKFNSSHARLWGTYYGGSSLSGFPSAEGIYDAVCDAYGNLYIVGSTHSSNNIATTGSFQPNWNGNIRADGFLAKFNAAGVRQWGTYYGTTGTEYMNSIDIGNDGLLYTAGYTTGSSNALATTGAHKTTFAAGFMAIWGQDGSRKYGTYYGSGMATDYICGLSCTPDGKLYFGGLTYSTTGIATTGSHQTNHAGGTLDAFLTQWDMDTLVYIRQPFTDTFVCTGDSLYVPYGVNQKFRGNNSFTVQLSNSSGSFASPVNIRSINSDTAGTIACAIPLNVPSGNGYRVRIVATAPVDTSLDNVVNIRVSSYPTNFSAGSNSPLCTGDTLKLNSGTTTTGVTYAWAGPSSYSNTTEDPVLPNATLAMAGNYYITLNNNGCAVKDTVTVVVNQTPENVTATNNGGLCTGDTMKLMSSTTTSGVNYAWAGPNNYNTQNVTIPNVQLSHAGTYIVTVTLGNCSDTASTTLTVDQSAVINIVPLTPVSICKGDTAQFSGFPNFAGTNPLLQWQINGVDVPNANGTVFKTPLLVNGDKVRLEVTPNTTCPGARVSNEITMTVQDLKAPQVSITADAGPSLFPNEPINFTAVATDAGNAPNYQWRKNGIDIGGATGAVWGANANALKDGDNICVLVTSTYACPNPDTVLSNCIQLDIRLSVDDVVNSNSIKVYPNPVKGTLRITSTTTIETITINNLLGQQLMQQTAKGNTADIDMSALASGVYVVKVNGVYAVRVTKE